MTDRIEPTSVEMKALASAMSAQEPRRWAVEQAISGARCGLVVDIEKSAARLEAYVLNGATKAEEAP